MMKSMDHSQIKMYMTMFSPMILPTKEKPSNSVRYSARSPRRMAMQYSTKPEPNTIPIREARMEKKVETMPVLLRKDVTRSSASSSAR